MTARIVYLGAGRIGDILVDNSSTAGDLVAHVRTALPNQQWHGNALLSSGQHRFKDTDIVEQVAGGCDLVLANFSSLARPGPNVRITTERSGITIPQIQQLLDFVYGMIGMVSEAERRERGLWTETFGEERQPLCFENFNLYHASHWIIKPATAATAARGPCSYVELVAENPDAQMPAWFVSHAWIEPIRLFLTCLRRHAFLRELECVEAYWVCAYANNQHALQEDMPPNPRKTSFYKAMQLCRGVLLVLDSNGSEQQATPFKRIWCCFELSIAVEERDTNSLLLDVAATDAAHVAHVITDGLAGAESRVMPILGLLCKSRREQSFPIHLLKEGLNVNITVAGASMKEDKTRILKSIASPFVRTMSLDTDVPTQHENYDAVNKALASHFALASIDQSYRNGYDPSDIWHPLQSDEEKGKVQVSLTGCDGFQDRDLQNLISHLPRKLQNLRLDLGYTGLERLDELCPSFGNLKTLVIRFTGPVRSVSGLSALICPSLRHLELWFSNLPDLEDIELGHGNEALLKLHLEELVLYVNGCPTVPGSSKKALFSAAQKLKRCRPCGPHMWLHIEESASGTWKQHFKCLWAKQLEVCRSQSDVRTGGTSLDHILDAATDPFPCNCCEQFHGNSDGYCNAHRLARFQELFSRCHIAFQYTELLVIFLVQAAADVESRALLALIIISLYPLLWMGLAQLVGGAATTICIILMSLLFASISYAVLRFDQMHRATLELALASEAICSQVLQPANLSHLSLVFGSDADDYPWGRDMRQNVTDLKENFLRARMHFFGFQNALRRVVDEDGVAGVVNVKIKRLADLEICQGADCHLDVLSCEIHCESLRDVQRVWGALRQRFHSEEEPWKIVALWDGFAQEEERRCSKIVMSMDGYLATVVLCVTSLAGLENNLSSLCRLADGFGLLDDAKPRRWLQTVHRSAASNRVDRGTLNLFLAMVLSLARFIAMLTAVYFTCQYFFRYGPSRWRDQLPPRFCDLLAFGNQPIDEGAFWHAVYLSAPYAILVVVFAHDLASNHSAPKPRRRKLSQILYDRYFGIEGSHYVFKVALLQCLTVLLQAFGKLHLLGGIVLFAEQQGVGVATTLKCIFWSFCVLLLCNSTYPSILLTFPESLRCRYISAMMDVGFDLGYVLTYLLMVVIGMMELHVNLSIWGNFGDRSQLGFTNSISPRFAFPSDLVQYLAVYMSIAHVCCACRSVERAMHQPKALKTWVAADCVRLRCFLKYIYTPCLVTILVYLLFCPDVYPGHTGDFTCFPCRCELHGRLESCGLAAQLQQQQLVIKGVNSLEPQAFKPLGCGLLQLSLANNSLVSLKAKSFEHLPCLQILDLSRSKLSSLDGESFFGLDKLEVLSLHGNELRDISATQLSHLPSLEQLLLGSKAGWDASLVSNYELERGNFIQVLPPRLFEGNPRLKCFDVSGNNITDIRQDAFAGAELEILDLSSNQLRELDEGLFAGLSGLQELWLNNNRLSSLPPGLFATLGGLRKLGLNNNRITSIREGLFAGLSGLHILWLYRNRLNSLPDQPFAQLSGLEELWLSRNDFSTLPSGFFAGLDGLQKLGLNHNGMSAIPENLFAGLSNLKELWLGNNNLSVLPAEVFARLSALQVLGLDNNRFSSLPEGLFAGLSGLRRVWLSHNQLTSIPEGAFAGLFALQELGLNNNSLSSLPEGLFTKLCALRILWLHRNRLSNISEGLFDGLSVLQELGLNNNSLSSLPEGLFADLSGLRKLWLGNNDLSSLPEGLFAGLSGLQELGLNNNRFSSIPEGLFAGLSGLRIVWLSHNQLTSIPEGAFAGLFALQQLGLNNNSLSSLPEGLFAGLSALQELWLNHNSLSSLPEALFADLSGLRKLFLGNNDLSSLAGGLFAGLSGLQELGLNNNRLSLVPEGLFSGLSGLWKLWLSNNHLSSLPEGAFAGLAALQELGLNNNRLSSLPEGLFAGLSALQELWLNHNSLSSLPEALFADLSGLRKLFLDNNDLS